MTGACEWSNPSTALRVLVFGVAGYALVYLGFGLARVVVARSPGRGVVVRETTVMTSLPS